MSRIRPFTYGRLKFRGAVRKNAVFTHGTSNTALFRKFLRDNDCELQFDAAFYEQFGANDLDKTIADILAGVRYNYLYSKNFLLNYRIFLAYGRCHKRNKVKEIKIANKDLILSGRFYVDPDKMKLPNAAAGKNYVWAKYVEAEQPVFKNQPL